MLAQFSKVKSLRAWAKHHASRAGVNRVEAKTFHNKNYGFENSGIESSQLPVFKGRMKHTIIAWERFDVLCERVISSHNTTIALNLNPSKNKFQ